jgi:hypothetical protein
MLCVVMLSVIVPFVKQLVNPFHQNIFDTRNEMSYFKESRLKP